MKQRTFLLSAMVLSAILAVAVHAQDWPNWRGPNFDGSADVKNLPAQFSPTEKVRWAVDLPGPSAATPIVWGDRIFLSSTDPEQEALLAMCLDRRTGAVLWKHSVGSGYQPEGRGNPIRLDARSDYASPSPVTDGKRVIFFYGNGDLMAFNLEGERLWARNMQQDYGDFCFGWTFSSTPQLYEGRLYFQLLQRDLAVSGRGADGSKSYLFAFDPATGQEQWRVERPSAAKMESREAFTTPIPFENNGRKELLLMGGDALTGHDPATGKELWRWGTWNVGHNHPTLRVVPSAVAGGGVVLACAPKNYPVFAVKVGLEGVHQDESGLAWRSPERSPITSDVPTPLYYQDRFYILSDLRRSITCVNPADGEVVWQAELPGRTMCWASPTGSDGKLYLMNLRGTVFVLNAEDGQLLATNEMAEDEDEIRSSIAAAHDSLFIRTNSRLYCIGE
jgi:outer membrane protein assembly factor BamB